MEKYQQLKSLGSGGFGSVYLVKRKQDGELFALKEMAVGGAKLTEEDADKERDSYIKLDHVNIVKYVDHFILRSGINMVNYCIVIEYCDGGSLQDKIKATKESAERFSELQILRWCLEVVRALIYLQHRGMIHRDIKPANLLLKNGVLKLADFGVVKIIAGSLDTYSKDLSTKGTPRYWPPECFEIEFKAVNSKWDIWALGCVVHELATLNATFSGSGLAGVMQCVMNKDPKPVPKEYRYIQKIVDGALKKNAAERSTAEEIKMIVESAMNRLEVEVESQSSKEDSKHVEDRIARLEENLAQLNSSIKVLHSIMGKQQEQMKLFRMDWQENQATVMDKIKSLETVVTGKWKANENVIKTMQTKFEKVTSHQASVMEKVEHLEAVVAGQRSDYEEAINRLEEKINILNQKVNNEQMREIADPVKKLQNQPNSQITADQMSANTQLIARIELLKLTEVGKKMAALVNQMKAEHSMSLRAEAAFLSIDRVHFWAKSSFFTSSADAYTDTYCDDSVLCRESHYVGVVNAVVDAIPAVGGRVLIVSDLCGYLVSLMSRLVGESGTVMAQHLYDDWMDVVKKNLSKDPSDIQRNITHVTGSEYEPIESHIPYHAIIHYSGLDKSQRRKFVPAMTPNGILVCYSRENSKWVAYQRTEENQLNLLSCDIP